MFDLNLGHPFASIYQNGKVDFDGGAGVSFFSVEWVKRLGRYFAGILDLNSFVFATGPQRDFTFYRSSSMMLNVQVINDNSMADSLCQVRCELNKSIRKQLDGLRRSKNQIKFIQNARARRTQF